ncbi:alpha-2-HS-glycoprotein [Sander lucioperca]|uniref:Si:ch211-262h13.5 n=1 Tax=Sander lucioperca TaxID=283035 RepID=A0A8D0AD18_SANLU|nr:alpha-2-HS-glycoprotein [Sander lucioperca]XP_031139729.1 alpha-2-HS-glycoprotein [Sander lucioperca]
MAESICTLLRLLSLLSVHTLCVYAEGFALSPIELAPIPCNDKAVEKLSRLAVTYINEDRPDGYKFALNRIANVHLHAQGPAGNVYYLDLDVLETKCHIGSPKPWKRCDVRPFMETQISGNCNTTILHTPEGYSYLYSYDCTLVPDPPEKLQQTCPTCPLLLPVDSPQAVNAAQATLASYKRQSTLGAELGVKNITRAAAQVVPVKASFVEYTVQQCPEGVTERGTCRRLTLKSDTETAGFCAGSVHGDLSVYPDVRVSCEMFKAQDVDIFRPVQPQGHELPHDHAIPTFPTLFDDPGDDLLPVPSYTTLPPAVQPPPFDPTPILPLPFDPPVVINPFIPLSSSSSESAEDLVNQQQRPPGAGPSASSSEEIGGPVALRPPNDFHYKRRDRKRRQALVETSPSHNPTFLSDFPSGSSPFRSCPGPARYTTV